MLARPGEPIDLRAILKAHGHAARFRELYDRFHAIAVAPSRYHNAV